MKPEVFVFRLYVTAGPRSMEAITNLRRICETHLPGRHDIEIVDIALDPMRALEEEIYLIPTLVSVSPYPGHRIVGTLSNTEPILQILGLEPQQFGSVPARKDQDSLPQVRRPG